MLPPTLPELMHFVRARTAPAAVPLVSEIVIHQGTDFTELWQAAAQQLRGDRAAPFWAFPWCGGQAIARYLLDRPEAVRGRRVFDFATGSGLVAIAAARAGAAQVIASDLDPLSEAAVRLNAELNQVQVAFRFGDSIGDALHDFDLLLAGDVFYERQLASDAMRWFRDLTRRGLKVLVGDPGRTYSAREGVSDRASYDVPSAAQIESRPVLRTWVMEVEP